MSENELSVQTFSHSEFGEIRAIEQNDEPWFVAKDICDALGLSQVSRAVNSLDDDEKNTLTISKGIKGNPNKVVISESGFYKLAMRSRKPEANAFSVG